MKKTLWMLGVAVAALTSCTQSEVLDVPESRVIGFEPFVGKSTRAGDVKATMLVGATGGENDLKNFWVFGNYTGTESDEGTPFDGGDNSKLYWDATNSAFKYDNARQWHKGIYHFAAYSNGNEKINNGVAFSSTSTPTPTSTLTFTEYVNNGNQDLVAAIPAQIEKDETNMDAGVPLDFKHMLACIELEFTNNSPTNGGYYLDFQDLMFSANSKATCTYDGTTINWVDDSTPKEYEFKTNIYNHDVNATENKDPAVLLGPSDKAKFHCFVIPQSNATVELTFKIASYTRAPQLDGSGNEVKDPSGNTVYDYTYTSTEPYEASLSISTSGHTSWQPGILYKYTASVSGQTHYINFTVTSFEGWTTTGKPSVDTPISPTDN